ncbi:glucose-6-phosphate isomerase [Neisseria zoodegmatis]|uniref:Glucose-6-phosphate isomerase n=1 Tax=Neisseria zoodegmatis TaxID=326523 RepID=A0AB38DMX5_9NEIS|nr:glucose-6-phosphate isomerase [Neisseria zoodegmatis]OSI10180.1 glucose-6-phosphate isomerase [Neisseria zoodegmatis]SNU78545.1 glucose-6-phosphate isomerase [Neisseria zoodegmatis]
MTKELTAIWQDLQAHQINTSSLNMRDQFQADPARFDKMHETLHGLLLDYSKNRISEETLDLLCRLADASGVKQQAEAMRRGDKINLSENRAVLHTALRLPVGSPAVYVDGESVLSDIHRELERALTFADSLLNGSHTGATGKRITDFVHIGIGGSDLGPQLAVQALQPYLQNIRVHFVSNSDDANIAQVLAPLNPETTVFCVASKSFGTPETLLNAQAARNWFCDRGLNEADIARHFTAISSNVEAARDFGITPEHVFAMFDFVGGRYSVWSAIGLPVMVAIGSARFRELLNGAHAMDEHFFHTDFRHNMPVLLALLGVWYGNFCNACGHAVVPYSHNLRRLPAYLKQLDMESNGKRRTLQGETVSWHTGGIVFGEEGVNGQHAFFQLLHQGTRLIPTDFIVPMRTPYNIGRQHRFTVANAFAQAEALMLGKTLDEARAELAGLPEAEREALAPHKEFPGNRPSNSILIDELNPFNLGMLLALYEHKIFVQGVIWNINPFDQWGVEYGKVLAKNIEPELEQTTELHHDASTNGLIGFYRRCTRDT